ncbi:GTP-binding protein rab11, variant 2 [Capsaspora owczarzaki ATCC 30864]|uniref:GTP-binding protein rab11, variant 2 n=1 Tax=Capsaspora owczarzaki (strain ATCC 30864) TaxID=595528 RepID=A0A0D2WN62_CAPO3|nr:GTP-binding protein rab11, variant 2 [Capsaspora owczarzaki ATCC 30864]
MTMSEKLLVLTFVFVVSLSETGVGKTSLVLRYVQGTYAADITSTIGASFMTRKMTVDRCQVRMQVGALFWNLVASRHFSTDAQPTETVQIWDTAGQERFRSMAPMYYRGANAALLVYDITDEQTFDDIKSWVKELQHNVDSDIVLVLVGNKSDMASQRKVSGETAAIYAEEINALFFETSAKADSGRSRVFKSSLIAFCSHAQLFVLLLTNVL